MAVPEAVVPILDNDVYTIVACGASAQNWIPRGHSIGINDAFKFGKPFDSLLICNRPEQFPRERLSVIKSTPHKTFYTNNNNDWKHIFPNAIKLPIAPWYGVLNPGQCYKSDTASFIALSLCHYLNAKTIIMYGVDFLNHSKINASNPHGAMEIDLHRQIINFMRNERGINVYLGEKGTAFDEHLQVYQNENG